MTGTGLADWRGQWLGEHHSRDDGCPGKRCCDPHTEVSSLGALVLVYQKAATAISGLENFLQMQHQLVARLTDCPARKLFRRRTPLGGASVRPWGKRTMPRAWRPPSWARSVETVAHTAWSLDDGWEELRRLTPGRITLLAVAASVVLVAAASAVGVRVLA